MAKKIPTRTTILPVSSITQANYSFWFSDNIEDWMFSHKNTMTRIRARNDFEQHMNSVTAFKRKHG